MPDGKIRICAIKTSWWGQRDEILAALLFCCKPPLPMDSLKINKSERKACRAAGETSVTFVGSAGQQFITKTENELRVPVLIGSLGPKAGRQKAVPVTE